MIWRKTPYFWKHPFGTGEHLAHFYLCILLGCWRDVVRLALGFFGVKSDDLSTHRAEKNRGPNLMWCLVLLFEAARSNLDLWHLQNAIRVHHQHILKSECHPPISRWNVSFEQRSQKRRCFPLY